VDRAANRLRGIWAAVVTPIDSRLSPDSAKAIPYYRDLLARGCDGINLFGTTGEAMSFGAKERLTMMEAIAGSDVPMERLMTGTGAASLDDAATITRQALDLNFAAALVMPPFFYRDAGDDGVMRFFDELFSRVSPPYNSIILYNFPQMSGITFHAGLTDRLMSAFPRTIVGVKDSSNDRALQAELLQRHPQLAIFPGSEHYLAEALAAGAAGCISGSVALWPELAQSVYLRRFRDDSELLAAKRTALAGLPFIPTVRTVIASQRDDDSWRKPMPPLIELTASESNELRRRLGSI